MGKIRNRIFTLIMMLIMCFSLVGINTDFSYAATKKPAKVSQPVVKKINSNKYKVTYKKVKKVKIGKKSYTPKYQIAISNTYNNEGVSQTDIKKLNTSKTSYTFKPEIGKNVVKVRAYIKKGSAIIYGSYSKNSKSFTVTSADSKEEKETEYKENYSKTISNKNIKNKVSYVPESNENCFTITTNSTNYDVRAIDNTPAKVKRFFGTNQDYSVNRYDRSGKKLYVYTSPYTSDIKINIFDKTTKKLVYCDTYGWYKPSEVKKNDGSWHDGIGYTPFKNNMFEGATDSNNPFIAKYNDLLNKVINEAGATSGNNYADKLRKCNIVLGRTVFSFWKNEDPKNHHDERVDFYIHAPGIDCANNIYAENYYKVLGFKGSTANDWAKNGGVEITVAQKIDPSVNCTTATGEYGNYIIANFSDGSSFNFDLTCPNCEGYPLEVFGGYKHAVHFINYQYTDTEHHYYTYYRNWIKIALDNSEDWFVDR